MRLLNLFISFSRQDMLVLTYKVKFTCNRTEAWNVTQPNSLCGVVSSDTDLV